MHRVTLCATALLVLVGAAAALPFSWFFGGDLVGPYCLTPQPQLPYLMGGLPTVGYDLHGNFTCIGEDPFWGDCSKSYTNVQNMVVYTELFPDPKQVVVGGENNNGCGMGTALRQMAYDSKGNFVLCRVLAVLLNEYEPQYCFVWPPPGNGLQYN